VSDLPVILIFGALIWVGSELKRIRLALEAQAKGKTGETL